MTLFVSRYFRSFHFFAVTAALTVAFASPSLAASLTFSPVGVDIQTPAKAGNISLINNSGVLTRVQVRIFRWKQVDGKEVLEPTRDVVASPPVAAIPPGAKYTLRVARIAPAPVTLCSFCSVLRSLPFSARRRQSLTCSGGSGAMAAKFMSSPQTRAPIT
ncbi:MAG: molecular chaperone [Sphingomonadales bacterium]|nr:molecular chaperone [Sphingomonadales bacterium]